MSFELEVATVSKEQLEAVILQTRYEIDDNIAEVGWQTGCARIVERADGSKVMHA